MSTKDPVLAPLRRISDSVDKRRWEGKMLAGQISEITERVKAEREEALEAVKEFKLAAINARHELEEAHEAIEARNPKLIDEGDQRRVEARKSDDYDEYTGRVTSTHMDFTLLDLEEILFQFRCAGARDASPVQLHTHALTCKTALPLGPTRTEQHKEADAEARRKQIKRTTKVGGALAVVTFAPIGFWEIGSWVIHLYRSTMGF